MLNKLMARGIVPPEPHGVLDYPLAAIIIAGPVVFDFDSTARRGASTSDVVQGGWRVSRWPGRGRLRR